MRREIKKQNTMMHKIKCMKIIEKYFYFTNIKMESYRRATPSYNLKKTFPIIYEITSENPWSTSLLVLNSSTDDSLENFQKLRSSIFCGKLRLVFYS